MAKTILKNVDLAERLEQAHSSFISKMYWIASCHETYDLRNLLVDLGFDELIEMFPDIPSPLLSDTSDKGAHLLEAILDHDKFGIIANVYMPIPTNITFDEKGEFRSCSFSQGLCTSYNVYAESLEGIVEQIEKKSDKLFNRYVDQAKKK